DISRQLFERGAGVDEVIFRDLARAYATELDNQCINADGTSGTHLGIRSTAGIIAVTYTDATPTLAETYPKIADAIQQMQTGIYAGEIFLWETNSGAPFELRAEQPLANQLSIRLVAYGYSAFTAARRPKAAAVISGTGCAAPSF